MYRNEKPIGMETYRVSKAINTNSNSWLFCGGNTSQENSLTAIFIPYKDGRNTAIGHHLYYFTSFVSLRELLRMANFFIEGEPLRALRLKKRHEKF